MTSPIKKKLNWELTEIILLIIILASLISFKLISNICIKLQTTSIYDKSIANVKKVTRYTTGHA